MLLVILCDLPPSPVPISLKMRAIKRRKAYQRQCDAVTRCSSTADNHCDRGEAAEAGNPHRFGRVAWWNIPRDARLPGSHEEVLGG